MIYYTSDYGIVTPPPTPYPFTIEFPPLPQDIDNDEEGLIQKELKHIPESLPQSFPDRTPAPAKAPMGECSCNPPQKYTAESDKDYRTLLNDVQFVCNPCSGIEDSSFWVLANGSVYKDSDYPEVSALLKEYPFEKIPISIERKRDGTPENQYIDDGGSRYVRMAQNATSNLFITVGWEEWSERYCVSWRTNRTSTRVPDIYLGFDGVNYTNENDYLDAQGNLKDWVYVRGFDYMSQNQFNPVETNSDCSSMLNDFAYALDMNYMESYNITLDITEHVCKQVYDISMMNHQGFTDDTYTVKHTGSIGTHNWQDPNDFRIRYSAQVYPWPNNSFDVSEAPYIDSNGDLVAGVQPPDIWNYTAGFRLVTTRSSISCTNWRCEVHKKGVILYTHDITGDQWFQVKFSPLIDYKLGPFRDVKWFYEEAFENPFDVKSNKGMFVAVGDNRDIDELDLHYKADVYYSRNGLDWTSVFVSFNLQQFFPGGQLEHLVHEYEDWEWLWGNYYPRNYQTSGHWGVGNDDKLVERRRWISPTTVSQSKKCEDVCHYTDYFVPLKKRFMLYSNNSFQTLDYIIDTENEEFYDIVDMDYGLALREDGLIIWNTSLNQNEFFKNQSYRYELFNNGGKWTRIAIFECNNCQPGDFEMETKDKYESCPEDLMISRGRQPAVYFLGQFQKIGYFPLPQDVGKNAAWQELWVAMGWGDTSIDIIKFDVNFNLNNLNFDFYGWQSDLHNEILFVFGAEINANSSPVKMTNDDTVAKCEDGKIVWSANAQKKKNSETCHTTWECTPENQSNKLECVCPPNYYNPSTISPCNTTRGCDDGTVVWRANAQQKIAESPCNGPWECYPDDPECPDKSRCKCDDGFDLPGVMDNGNTIIKCPSGSTTSYLWRANAQNKKNDYYCPVAWDCDPDDTISSYKMSCTCDTSTYSARYINSSSVIECRVDGTVLWKANAQDKIDASDCRGDWRCYPSSFPDKRYCRCDDPIPSPAEWLNEDTEYRCPTGADPRILVWYANAQEKRRDDSGYYCPTLYWNCSPSNTTYKKSCVCDEHYDNIKYKGSYSEYGICEDEYGNETIEWYANAQEKVASIFCNSGWDCTPSSSQYKTSCYCYELTDVGYEFLNDDFYLYCRRGGYIWKANAQEKVDLYEPCAIVNSRSLGEVDRIKNVDSRRYVNDDTTLGEYLPEFSLPGSGTKLFISMLVYSRCERSKYVFWRRPLDLYPCDSSVVRITDGFLPYKNHMDKNSGLPGIWGFQSLHTVSSLHLLDDNSMKVIIPQGIKNLEISHKDTSYIRLCIFTKDGKQIIGITPDDHNGYDDTYHKPSPWRIFIYNFQNIWDDEGYVGINREFIDEYKCSTYFRCVFNQSASYSNSCNNVYRTKENSWSDTKHFNGMTLVHSYDATTEIEKLTIDQVTEDLVIVSPSNIGWNRYTYVSTTKYVVFDISQSVMPGYVPQITDEVLAEAAYCPGWDVSVDWECEQYYNGHTRTGTNFPNAASKTCTCPETGQVVNTDPPPDLSTLHCWEGGYVYDDNYSGPGCLKERREVFADPYTDGDYLCEMSYIKVDTDPYDGDWNCSYAPFTIETDPYFGNGLCHQPGYSVYSDSYDALTADKCFQSQIIVKSDPNTHQYCRTEPLDEWPLLFSSQDGFNFKHHGTCSEGAITGMGIGTKINECDSHGITGYTWHNYNPNRRVPTVYTGDCAVEIADRGDIFFGKYPCRAWYSCPIYHTGMFHRGHFNVEYWDFECENEFKVPDLRYYVRNPEHDSDFCVKMIADWVPKSSIYCKNYDPAPEPVCTDVECTCTYLTGVTKVVWSRDPEYSTGNSIWELIEPGETKNRSSGFVAIVFSKGLKDIVFEIDEYDADDTLTIFRKNGEQLAGIQYSSVESVSNRNKNLWQLGGDRYKNLLSQDKIPPGDWVTIETLDDINTYIIGEHTYFHFNSDATYKNRCSYISREMTVGWEDNIASYGMNITHTRIINGKGAREKITIDEAKEDIIVFVLGSGVYAITEVNYDFSKIKNLFPPRDVTCYDPDDEKTWSEDSGYTMDIEKMEYMFNDEKDFPMPIDLLQCDVVDYWSDWSPCLYGYKERFMPWMSSSYYYDPISPDCERPPSFHDKRPCECYWVPGNWGKWEPCEPDNISRRCRTWFVSEPCCIPDHIKPEDQCEERECCIEEWLPVTDPCVKSKDRDELTWITDPWDPWDYTECVGVYFGVRTRTRNVYSSGFPNLPTNPKPRDYEEDVCVDPCIGAQWITDEWVPGPCINDVRDLTRNVYMHRGDCEQYNLSTKPIDTDTEACISVPCENDSFWYDEVYQGECDEERPGMKLISTALFATDISCFPNEPMFKDHYVPCSTLLIDSPDASEPTLCGPTGEGTHWHWKFISCSPCINGQITRVYYKIGDHPDCVFPPIDPAFSAEHKVTTTVC